MSATMLKTIAPRLKRAMAGAIGGIAMAASASAETILIDNGQVHTMVGDGEQVIQGDVLVRNGRIVRVAEEIAAPNGATVIDATDKIVTPGLFAPSSQLGLVEISLDREANDSRPGEGFALSAALDAGDGFNPSSTLIPINRAGGVTRAVSAPTQGGKIFGGQAIVVDLSGDADSVTQTGVAQSVTLGFQGAVRSGDTRLGVWAHLREYMAEAKRYAEGPRAYALAPRDPRFSLSDLKALGPVVRGDQLLMVAVNEASDIRSLIKFKNEYGLDVAISGGAEAWKVADELAAAGVAVVLDPMENLPSQHERLGATLENAAILHKAGVRIAFSAPGTHNLRLLPQSAGNAVANGLPHAAALVALTRAPAEMFGLSNALGTLESGKVADVVVWNGDPLEVSSRPVTVLINGEIASLENRQTIMRDRYLDLSRGRLPLAYPRP